MASSSTKSPDASQYSSLCLPAPPWSKVPCPQHVWCLIEIKAGVEVEKHILSSRPYTLLGRAADQVHISLQHESCSRCHARIAFDAGGIPWLRDCQSAHGSFVNKRRMPPEACFKGPEKSIEQSTAKGARGVILYPGDVLRFGSSSRIFCLEGPEEFERGSLRRTVVTKGPNEQSTSAATATPNPSMHDSPLHSNNIQEIQTDKTQEHQLVSWGIDMEEPAEDNEGNRGTVEQSQSRSRQIEMEYEGLESSIQQKYQKLWERICSLKHKLSNVQTESSRIERKRVVEELNEGQERQLQRNQQLEKQLQESLMEKENDLYQRLFPDNKKPRLSHQTSASEDQDDGEDAMFYDRTRATERRKFNSENENVETEQTLSAKRNTILCQLQKNEKLSEKAQQRLDKLEMKLKSIPTSVDNEEVFFTRNSLDLAKDESQKLQAQQTILLKSLTETEKLLKVANPNLQFGTYKKQSKSRSNQVDTTVPSQSFPIPMPRQLSSMPPPSFKNTTLAISNDAKEKGVFIEKGKPPPHANSKNATGISSNSTVRRRVIGPMAPPAHLLKK